MKTIIKSVLFMCLALTATVAISQDKPKSPPASMSDTFGGVDVTIDYNAPSQKGRTLWGDLVPYNKVWRTGANGATKITVGSDIEVEGQTLAAGTYSIFTIPSEESWTVIFNNVADQWGSNNYAESEDALRVMVTPVMADESTEVMTFMKADDSTIHLAWGNLKLPINLGPVN